MGAESVILMDLAVGRLLDCSMSKQQEASAQESAAVHGKMVACDLMNLVVKDFRKGGWESHSKLESKPFPDSH